MRDQSLQQLRRRAVPFALLLAALAMNGCTGPDTEAATATSEILEQVATREARVAEREQEIAGRETALAEQGLELAARLESLTEREEDLESRAATLEDRAAGLDRRAAEANQQAAALGEIESRLAADQKRVAETRAAAERETERQRQAARRDPPAVFTEIELTAETRLEVEFLTSVSSASNRVGDTFRTRLTNDLYAGDGRLVVPAGTELQGVVTEAVPLAKRVGGQAALGLRFGELQLPWGRSVEVNASFYDSGRDQTRRGKKVIGGAAAGGAVLGAILDDDDRGRGTLIGAILGAAAGTAAAANRPRDEVEIPGGTVVSLELDEPAMVMVPWKSSHAAP